MDLNTSRSEHEYSLQELLLYERQNKECTHYVADGKRSKGNIPMRWDLLGKDILDFWGQDYDSATHSQRNHAHTRALTLLWSAFYGKPLREMTQACKTERVFRHVVDIYFMDMREIRRQGQRYAYRCCGAKTLKEINDMLVGNNLPRIDEVAR